MDWRIVPNDGVRTPVYLGDTTKYLYDILDEDAQPFEGDITGARFELMKLVDGVPAPLDVPVVKTIAGGQILELTGPTLQVILLPTDTQNLPEGQYVAAIKVSSATFGERTYVRLLWLSTMFMDAGA
jgi:hypothetical protein